MASNTTGAPVSLRVENRDWANWEAHWAQGDLTKLTVPRPGHADYAGMCKYGLDDARPILERASARETAARVAVGPEGSGTRALVLRLLGENAVGPPATALLPLSGTDAAKALQAGEIDAETALDLMKGDE